MMARSVTPRPQSSLLWRTYALALSVLVAFGARAGEVTRFDLESEGDGYRLNAQALIEAPLDRVWEVLTDYAALDGVSPRILESELVSVSPEGVSRVRTLNQLCFLAFCRDLRHLQLIRELGHGDFESNSVPEESDLSRGYARWRLVDQGRDTRLEIDFRFAMDSYSWVPPWVSRVVARFVLNADTAQLVQGIERSVRVRDDQADGD